MRKKSRIRSRVQVNAVWNPKPIIQTLNLTVTQILTQVLRWHDKDDSEGSNDGPVVSDQETDEQMEEDYARIGERFVNRYLEISTPVNAIVAVGDVNVSAVGRDFTVQTEEEQARLIRLTVMGNVVRRNSKWVCETYGVLD